MPVLPTIADVFRVTLNWNAAHGFSPRNVCHFQAVTGTEADVVAALEASWDDAMWHAVQQDWAFTSVDVLKLDGVSATQTFPVTAQGSLTSGDWVVGTAAVLSLHTAQRGSRGRGRMFLGPIAEARLIGGRVSPSNDIVVGWGAFIASMISEGVPMGVASYAHADFHPITSHRIDSVPGQQRRRNDAQR